MEAPEERGERVRRLMADFGFTEAEALRILAEAGDGDIRADPPLTEEDRQRLGLTRRSLLDDPRIAFLKGDASARTPRS